MLMHSDSRALVDFDCCGTARGVQSEDSGGHVRRSPGVRATGLSRSMRVGVCMYTDVFFPIAYRNSRILVINENLEIL